MEQETLIEVRDLKKHFGGIKAVDGISFSVRRGEILGFMGPNGAGKSTAMKMITGFLTPDAGTIRVAGKELATDSLSARKTIGYLPESAPAYGEMTVNGFLRFVGQARGLSDIDAAIARVARQTGLKNVLFQVIDTLSKGYKRRVGLAQALIHDPDVLILDEPTDGLDPNQKALVQELIGNLSRSKCIILSTHILDEVERVCNRAMIISQGKILTDATPQALLAQAPNHHVIHVTLGQDNQAFCDLVQQQPWVAQVVKKTHTQLEIVPKNKENHLKQLMELTSGFPIEAISLEEGRLDDLFRSITKGVTA